MQSATVRFLTGISALYRCLLSLVSAPSQPRKLVVLLALRAGLLPLNLESLGCAASSQQSASGATEVLNAFCKNPLTFHEKDHRSKYLGAEKSHDWRLPCCLFQTHSSDRMMQALVDRPRNPSDGTGKFIRFVSLSRTNLSNESYKTESSVIYVPPTIQKETEGLKVLNEAEGGRLCIVSSSPRQSADLRLPPPAIRLHCVPGCDVTLQTESFQTRARFDHVHERLLFGL